MTYDEIKQCLPDVTFFYFGVTMEEVENLPVTGWWGQAHGSIYLGTMEAVDALAAKEVKAD